MKKWTVWGVAEVIVGAFVILFAGYVLTQKGCDPSPDQQVDEADLYR